MQRSFSFRSLVTTGQLFLLIMSLSSLATFFLNECYRDYAKFEITCLKDSLFLKMTFSAVHGEKYTEKLKKDLNDEERLPLVEKLGDIYGEAKSSAKALECYQQQVFSHQILILELPQNE